MLSIENLNVSIDGKKILSDINVQIDDGKAVVLFGPNGSGKTTLLMSIVGIGDYKVESGRIYFKGVDITNLPAYERVKMGIGVMFQRPPTVKGVKIEDIVKLFDNFSKAEYEKYVKEFKAEYLINRSINDGFSGGEIKRSELLQLLIQKPELSLIDEPESGVDFENIEVVGKAIKRLLGKEFLSFEDNHTMKNHRKSRKSSGLIITHTGIILDYVPADEGLVLIDGRIVCKGNPYEIFDTIKNKGFDECLRCAIKD